MSGDLPGLPPRTVAEAQEKYLKAVEILFKTLDPEDIAADRGNLEAHLRRYGRAFAVVEVMMDFHQRIMKAVMGTHAAKLPLPSAFGASFERLFPVPEEPSSRASEPSLAVELLRRWATAFTATPKDADGFELLRETKEFVERVSSPDPVFFWITLSWPVGDVCGEQVARETFYGTLDLNPGATTSGMIRDVLSGYAAKLKVKPEELLVQALGFFPERLT